MNNLINLEKENQKEIKRGRPPGSKNKDKEGTQNKSLITNNFHVDTINTISRTMEEAELYKQQVLGALRQNYGNRYQARNYMATSFKPEMYDIWRDNWLQIEKHGISYMTYQNELAPTTGAEHIQIYLECNKVLDYNSIKVILEEEALWLCRRIGTQNQAVAYVNKVETACRPNIELGLKKNQGDRTDIGNVMMSIANGSSLIDIMEEYPETYFRYYKNILHVFNEQLKKGPIWKTTETTIFIGKGGSGKTSNVFEIEKHSDIYKLEISSTGIWWDGYQGQSVLLIDDMYKGMISLYNILNWTDGYKLALPTKGGWTTKNWDRVYITSNYPCDEWFHEGNVMSDEHKQHEAWKRRITRIVMFPDNKKINRKEIEIIKLRG